MTTDSNSFQKGKKYKLALLNWEYIRGFYESCGTYQEKSSIFNRPRKVIFNCSNDHVIEGVSKFINIPHDLFPTKLCFTDICCLELFDNMYKNVDVKECENERGYSVYEMLKSLNFYVKWVKTDIKACELSNNFHSQIWYDLSIVKFVKKESDVYFFDTCISLELYNDIYFEIIPKKELILSGWNMIETIFIDSSYKKSVIIELIKTRENLSDIILPCSYFKLVPRKLIVLNMHNITNNVVNNVV